jgi:hypothetical protein
VHRMLTCRLTASERVQMTKLSDVHGSPKRSRFILYIRPTPWLFADPIPRSLTGLLDATQRLTEAVPSASPGLT